MLHAGLESCSNATCRMQHAHPGCASLIECYDPAVQPSQLSNVGIRYGIQIGQAFGWDFGYGIIKDICFVDFVIV